MNKETKKISYDAFKKEIGIQQRKFIGLDWDEQQKIINQIKKKNESNYNDNINNENVMINSEEKDNTINHSKQINNINDTKSVSLIKKLSKPIINGQKKV